MRNDIRDSVVTEVTSRVMNSCLARSEQTNGMALDVLINDTLYHEKKRLEAHRSAPNWALDLAFWDTVKGRLARAGDREQARLLESIISRFTFEVLGNFSRSVYEVSTRVLPTALPLLLQGLSPKTILSQGVPDLKDTIRLDGHIEALKRCQEHGTVILTPTHVSNLDSVVIGWALYALGLPPFTYGAGLNLFSNPVLAFFMRNLGAYRVDRTKKAPLYKQVLKEYATVCLEHGQSQLFFPGGTRSRSGQVESRLKLGLLSCGLRAYINNLKQRRVKPNIYIVPCTLNFHLVLEASTLIEDHLRAVGKSRYIITDDESFRPTEVLRFLRKLIQMEGELIINFAPPMDPFGNIVDAEGKSRDRRGRIIDTSQYVTVEDGSIDHRPQRDAVYTRAAGRRVTDSFRRYTMALVPQLLAFVVFVLLRRRHPNVDLYRLLRLSSNGVGLPMNEVASAMDLIVARARELNAEGIIHLDPSVAHEGAPALIASGLRYFSTYHRGGVLKRRGDRLFAEDMNLVYYYHNRLVGYGLERVLDEPQDGVHSS